MHRIDADMVRCTRSCAPFEWLPYAMLSLFSIPRSLYTLDMTFLIRLTPWSEMTIEGHRAAAMTIKNFSQMASLVILGKANNHTYLL